MICQINKLTHYRIANVITYTEFKDKVAIMQHVIIGSGIAGITTAEIIRKNRENDQIIVFDNEGEKPYWRASLSKYLMNIIPHEKMFVKPTNWFSDNNIQVIHAKVTKILSQEKQIHYIQNQIKNVIAFDRLCIATGATPITIPVPGYDLAEIATFRNLADVVKIKSQLDHVKHMLIIGGGVLGMELVEIAHFFGISCTVLQRGNKIGTPIVDDVAGEILLNAVTATAGANHSVEVILGDEIAEFVAENDHLAAAKLKSGRILNCDMAVFCIGITVNQHLFADSGLVFKGGLVVDEHQETSIPGIYAAGDCVVYPSESGPLTPTRTWVTSRIQGKTAGFNMCDIPCLLFDEGPMYNASYLFNINYTIIGEYSATGDRYQCYSCKPDAHSYRKVVFKNDRIVGAMMLGNRNGDQAIRRLIAHKLEIPAQADKEKLLDPAFDPNDLATKGIEYIMY